MACAVRQKSKALTIFLNNFTKAISPIARYYLQYSPQMSIFYLTGLILKAWSPRLNQRLHSII